MIIREIYAIILIPLQKITIFKSFHLTGAFPRACVPILFHLFILFFFMMLHIANYIMLLEHGM